MNELLRRARAARRRREDGDAGYTLVELIVAMGIFTTVLAVFMSGLMVMFRDTNRTQSAGQNTDALRKVFLQLDRQVRYADGVNVPGAAGTKWYAEFRTPQDGSRAAACYQWRYDTTAGTLAWRTWPASAAVPAASTGWTQVAAKLATGTQALGTASAPVRPFVMKAASLGTGAVHQQLVVAVNSGRSDGRGEQLQTTFVAVNSTVNSPGNLSSGSSGASSDNPVCSATNPRTP